MLIITIVFAAASCVSAQEAGQIGITTGYPASIGVVWHATSRIGIRGDFLFRGTASDNQLTETSSSTFGIGISGLVYLSRRDNLGLYVSPRYAYTHTSSVSEVQFMNSIGGSIVPISLPPVDSTTTTKSISGSFGAQYALHRRFSVFGEAGFEYTTADFSSAISSVLPITGLSSPDGPHTWGTRTAVGIVVYFRD